MDTKLKMRELLESMSAEQRAALAAELHGLTAPKREGVALEEITAERMSDSGFAARVREEINAALRGEI